MKIRVTAILIQAESILLVEQNVDKFRSWSLPGGGVEDGETLEDSLVREMKEETGLEVRVNELLYVCDYINDEKHVLHITFLVESVGGSFGKTIPGLDLNEIKSMSFVPINNLVDFGFTEKFKSLVSNGFPGKGSYMGAKVNIGL